MSDLFISWTDYHRKIEILAGKIFASAWEFEQIVCIAKGGLRIGDILARIYHKPLAIMVAASYGGRGNQIRGEISFSPNLAMLNDRLAGNILLVDDLVDSGITLQRSMSWLGQKYSSSIKEIRTAVIWYKASSEFVPHYYIDYLQNNPWIHQPFEQYEQMNPQQFIGLN